MAYLVFFAFGMLAGTAARLLLGRLRRGTALAPPWCELALGVLWAVCGGWWAAGRLPTAWLPMLLGLAWLAVAASATDLVHRRLPDALTLPAPPLAVLAAVPLGPESAVRGVAGGALLFGAHLAVRAAAPGALGAGDVKLAGSLGVVLGAGSWSALVVGAVLASALTTVVSLVVLLAGSLIGPRGPDRGIPHGPSMLAACWVVAAVCALST